MKARCNHCGHIWQVLNIAPAYVYCPKCRRVVYVIELQDKQQEIANLEGNYEKALDVIANRNDEVLQLRHENDELQTKVEHLHQENERLRQTVADLGSDNQHGSQDLLQAYKELTEARRQIAIRIEAGAEAEAKKWNPKQDPDRRGKEKC